MKLRKGILTDILSYTLIFTMFAAFIVAFVFNNSVQERRGLLVDFLNKEAMILQSQLEGYSDTSNFCFMYENGTKLSQSKAIKKKNTLITESKQRITDYFNEPRVASLLSLNGKNPINIEVIDGINRFDSATVKITVNFTAKFKEPYKTDGTQTPDSAGESLIQLSESASRVIENPIRLKNIKG